ncbi:MAG TPA: DMT family transporter [Verrucomicrobiae bacterium]|nr:DMT family transporter [Verrucomicrobiae bacterium]
MNLSSRSESRHPSPFVLGFWVAVMLLLWSLNYICGKIALRHFEPVTLACLRFVVASAIVLAIYFASSNRARPQARDLWPFLYLGVFNIILNQGLFTVGLGYTSSGHSAVITSSGPVFILLLAWLLKLEHLTPGKILGLVVCSFGILLLETDAGSVRNSPFLMGDFISLLGAIGFALYVVFGKRIAAQYDSLSMTTFSTVAATVVLLPLTVHQAIHLDWASVGWEGWSAMVYMAAGSSIAAYLIFYWALRHTTASRLGAVCYLQPLIVILLAAAILGERPTGHLLLATPIVLLGVFLAERAPA